MNNIKYEHNITFLIPVLGYKDISSTVDSILEQDIAIYEIIILRNGISNLKHKVSIGCKSFKLPAYSNYIIKEILISAPGKGNALNIGIQLAAHELICVIDADCIILPGAVKKLLDQICQPNVVAVGGKLIVNKSNDSWLIALQQLEYMRVFQVIRQLYNDLNAQCILSGAFTIFRKSALLNIGGYDIHSVGEDMEIILMLQVDKVLKRKNRIIYDTKAICETKTPQSLWRLMRQRDRWQRGLLDCLLKHWYMIGNPRYKMLGIVVMPYQLVVELLGPVIVGVSLLSLCFSNAHMVCSISLLLYLLLELFITLYAFYEEVDEDLTLFIKNLPTLILRTFADMLLQLPLMAARIYGMLTFLWRRTEW